VAGSAWCTAPLAATLSLTRHRCAAAQLMALPTQRIAMVQRQQQMYHKSDMAYHKSRRQCCTTGF
jgi:hypothetical protein